MRKWTERAGSWVSARRAAMAGCEGGMAVCGGLQHAMSTWRLGCAAGKRASGQVGKWVGALIKAQRAYHVQTACHGTGSRYHVTIDAYMHA
jgi:hypothetical protein